MADQVKVYAILSARDGREDELKRLLQGMTAASRSEVGNLQYDLWRDADRPSRFVLDERYRDAEAAAAHRASPHFQNYLSKINDLADRIAVAVLPVDVAHR